MVVSCTLVPLALQCVYGCSDKRNENGDEEEGKDLRFPELLYAVDLVLFGELEEDLKAMMEYFVEACRRRGLKVSTDKEWGDDVK